MKSGKKNQKDKPNFYHGNIGGNNVSSFNENANVYVSKHGKHVYKQGSMQPRRSHKAIIIAILLITLPLLLYCIKTLQKLNSVPPTIYAPLLLAYDDNSESITLSITAESNLKAYPDKSVGIFLSTSGPPDEKNDWVYNDNGPTILTVPTDRYDIYAIDAVGNMSILKKEEWSVVHSVELSDLPNLTYLPIGYSFALKGKALPFTDDPIIWTSDNTSVVTIEGEMATTVGTGQATITASVRDISTSFKINITDLYIISSYDEQRKVPISEANFTYEDETILDTVLKQIIETSGYKTRAGVVAAARFLSTQFPYKIPYFYENGRLDRNAGIAYCDGEGRFYHEGLYLTDSKFELLATSTYGPCAWGEPLINTMDAAGYIKGYKYPNGLDCSGFITWALLNGGFDVGDIGAGDNEGAVDLCDLGPKSEIHTAFRDNTAVVGDLLWGWGHIGIILEISDDTIYVAEALQDGVRTVSFNNSINTTFRSGEFIYTHVIDMSNIYGD